MNKNTYEAIRIAFILFFAFFISYFLPRTGLSNPGTIVPQTVLFSFLLGFFINRSIQRKQSLSQGISIELASLRHVHHVSEGLRSASFVKNVLNAIKKYHASMSAYFPNSEKANEAFRHMTHLVYLFRPVDSKDVPVYMDILSTTKELALERQRILTSLNASLSSYSFIMIAIAAFFVVVLSLALRDAGGTSHFGCAAIISGILIAMDLLRLTDRLSESLIEKYKNLYMMNMKKMGHED